MLFHGLVALLAVVLVSGLAWRQLLHNALYSERERLQNQRRIIVPGPRGTIYDRDGNVLVGNRPRFSVVLNLAELRTELRDEYRRVYRAYLKETAEDRPTRDQITRIARGAVAQRYLDQINTILGRSEQVNVRDLDRHFSQTLLLPYVLLDDLAPEEYARLLERLSVVSPMQVYASSTRYYPYGSTAAHVLGYVGVDDDPESEDLPGQDLLTFKMKGSFGRDGLEKQFDDLLQGQAGGAIYHVDPAGYKVDLPIEKRLPVQGRNLHLSLDAELQQAAQSAMTDVVGSAVALDVRTGEVLVMASAPGYDLNDFVPRIPRDTFRAINESGGWLNRAIQGQYPPGSTFKLVTSIAGLRSGAIDPVKTHTVCPGFLMVGNRRFPCNARYGHGERDVVGALRDSCNVFFYQVGLDLGPGLLSAEAKRLGLGQSTGIELPHEFQSPVVPDPDWKQRVRRERWFPGDTANLAIGQGDLLVTPLQIACMVASFCRNETTTKPTLLHDDRRLPQRTAPLGLTAEQHDVIVRGMEQGYQIGTGRLARVDGVRGATKTGTAQKGRIELGWMIAFAPADAPEIAIAVCLEGQQLDANYGGGLHAAPVVKAILAKWKEKSEREPGATFQLQ